MRGQKQHPLFSIGDWFIPANIFVIQSRQGYPLDLCTSLQAPCTVIMVKSEVSIFYLITAFVYSKCLLKDSKRNSILFTKKSQPFWLGLWTRNLLDLGFLLPWLQQNHMPYFFQNKEESSCPHSYYAKTDKKRIFVNNH